MQLFKWGRLGLRKNPAGWMGERRGRAGSLWKCSPSQGLFAFPLGSACWGFQVSPSQPATEEHPREAGIPPSQVPCCGLGWHSWHSWLRDVQPGIGMCRDPAAAPSSNPRPAGANGNTGPAPTPGETKQQRRPKHGRAEAKESVKAEVFIKN